VQNPREKGETGTPPPQPQPILDKDSPIGMGLTNELK